jgi:NADPH:quinone reductase-like Zn-dependent oxidoreductase/3-oxoacyl-(acyl-carrier-protein) synthase/acyl carrier protein
MSGVNAHAIIAAVPEEVQQQYNTINAEDNNINSSILQWKRSMRCFAEILIAVHPFLRTAVAAGKQVMTCKVPLSRPCLGFLWDHQVNGAAIMPGAAYLETAAAATSTLAKVAQPPAAVVGAAILAPLMLPELPEKSGAAVVMTVEMNVASGSVAISSSGVGATSAVVTSHLKASIVNVVSAATDNNNGAATSEKAPGVTLPSNSFEIARAVAAVPQATALLYESMRAAGLQYGRAFRLLRNVQHSNDAACAMLDGARGTAATTDPDISGFLVNPALLDNCLQLGAVVSEEKKETTTALEDAGAAAAAPEAYVPATVAAYLVQKSLRGVSALATIARRSPESSRKAAKATYRDHVLVGSNGLVLAALEGLEAKPLPGSGRSAGASAAAAKALLQEDTLYQIQWNASQLASIGSATSGDENLNSTQLSLAKGVHSTAVAGALLSTLQGAIDLQSQNVDLMTYTDSTASLLTSTASSAFGRENDFAGSEAWGMLRSFAAEAPAVGHGGIRLDPNTATATSSTAISVSNNKRNGASDGYGLISQGGIALQASLLSAIATKQAPPAFHLMPRPRGAFRNLVAEPVASAVASGKAGWVELQVKAVGINFRDVLNVLGMYPGDPGPPGGDCAGIVTRVPEGVDLPFSVGDAVFGLAAGSLGSYVVASPHTLVPLPKGMSFEEASTMPTVFITVDTALVQLAAVQPEERVLVHAAAGGVGLAAIQMAKSQGAQVIATAGSTNKRNLVRSLGVEAALGSRDTIFVSELAELGGADVVLNSLTSSGMVGGSLSVLRPGGRFVEISKRDIWSSRRVAQERPDVAYSLVAVDFMSEAALNAALTRVASAAAAGKLHPLPLVGHSLSAAASALRQMSQARHVGKIVVRSPALSSNSNSSGTDDGFVLVTGGLGVLGTQVAEWLGKQQVKAMSLLGRSGRPGDNQAAALAITSPASAVFNALVTMAACDVSASEGIVDAMQYHQQNSSSTEERTLKGILHAAGVLVDATLASQRFQGLQDVFGPKADAALALQRHAPDVPVAFQVLFSSVAALLGSPGQANYSAANALLDALAGATQQSGLAATSVQWGAWAGAGMAAGDSGTAARVERTGMALLPPPQGLAILEGMVLAAKPSDTVSVLAANAFVWPKFLQRFGSSKTTPALFTEFIEESSASTTGAAASGGARGGTSVFAGISPEQRKAAVADQVKDAVRSIVGQDVSPDEPLMAAGLDSLGAVELKNALEGRMGLQLPGTLVFDYPTVSALTEHLHSQIPDDVAEEEEVEEISASSTYDSSALGLPQKQLATLGNAATSTLALLGLSTRSATPGAILSTTGVDAITPVPLDRWDLEVLTQKSMLPARFGGYLPAADQFDLALFGLSTTEAELMDAQQRILLEGTYEALTQAGHPLSRPASVAVGVGIASAEYNNHLVANFTSGVSAYSATGGALSVASGRLSYTYAFRGPALSVDTACSSSLVATHVVATAVWSGTSTAALTAGIGLLLNPDPTAMFQKAGMLAPDGRCKTLDVAADGYVRGELAGVLFFQNLSAGATEASKSPALALLCGTAVNQDGRSSSLTAPNGPAQQEVIRTALQMAGLKASEVSHLQMHGTGTPLGDPIEMGAANAVLVDITTSSRGNGNGSRLFPLAASTAKSWIGHTEAAAGIMGLTQAAVGASHITTLAIMHLSMVNAHVRTILELQAAKSCSGSSGWHAARQSSGALGSLTGVSSFAFQGTNAHALVKQEHDDAETSTTVARSSKLATFAHQRVWIAPPANALLQRLAAFAGRGSRRQFATIEASLINTRLSFLREHVINRAPLVPAAVFIEAATAVSGLLFNATSLEDLMLSSVVFATPMLLVSGQKHTAVPKISCTVNLVSSMVEVASQQFTQDGAATTSAASMPHQRAHFYASLTKINTSVVTKDEAAEVKRPDIVAALLSGNTNFNNIQQQQPSAAIMAAVAVSETTENFQVHPATAEAAVHLCMAHPAAHGAGLRVAAKMDAASLSGSSLKPKPASSYGKENSCNVWALGMPGQSGKLNSHRLYSDGSAKSDGVLPLSALEGVQMRRLVTERPAMQQPK